MNDCPQGPSACVQRLSPDNQSAHHSAMICTHVCLVVVVVVVAAVGLQIPVPEITGIMSWHAS
jgi:hypothetical protein